MSKTKNQLALELFNMEELRFEIIFIPVDEKKEYIIGYNDNEGLYGTYDDEVEEQLRYGTIKQIVIK